MPLFSLVIKAASAEKAVVYANTRGFVVESIHASMPDVQNVTLMARGPWENAHRWFTEPSRVTPGKGFPTGTLLLFREVEPDLVLKVKRPHVNHDIEQPDLR